MSAVGPAPARIAVAAAHWAACVGVVHMVVLRGWPQAPLYLGVAAAVALMAAGAAEDLREPVREEAERQSKG